MSHVSQKCETSHVLHMWDIPYSSHLRHPIFLTVCDLSNKFHLKTISVWFSQPDFFLENYLEMCLNHGNTSLAITCETSYILHMWDTPYSSHVRHPISLTIWDIPYKLHLKSINAWFSNPLETSSHVFDIDIADMSLIFAFFSSSPRTDVSFIFHQNAMLRIEFPLKTLLHVFDIEKVVMSVIFAFCSSSPQTDVSFIFHQNAKLRIEFPLKTPLHVFDIENVDMSLILAFCSSSPQTHISFIFH